MKDQDPAAGTAAEAVAAEDPSCFTFHPHTSYLINSFPFNTTYSQTQLKRLKLCSHSSQIQNKRINTKLKCNIQTKTYYVMVQIVRYHYMKSLDFQNNGFRYILKMVEIVGEF
jgi:hypothetical protein